MQCYREETCKTKCHNNSVGQKASEMAGMVLHGNHHGYHSNNRGGVSYGQRHGSPERDSYHHAMSETKTYYSETQTYYPDQYAMGKTESAQCMSESGHGGPGHHVMGMGYGNRHHMGQQMAHGMSGGCHEKKVMNNRQFKKKSHFGHKHRDGNMSCSDSERGSDCD